MACDRCVTSLLCNTTERIIPFDLQASPGNAGVIPSQPVLELAAQQGVVAGEGIPGFGDWDVRADRDVGEGILGIVVAVAAAV